MKRETYALNPSIPDQSGEVVKLDRLRRDIERHVYVIEFSSGTIKVGQTRSPQKRIDQHSKAAAAHGHTVRRNWISGPHAEFEANERALIAFCAARWEASSGREYFARASFELIAEYAQALPFHRFTVEELERVAADGAERGEAFIRAIRPEGAAPSVEAFLPSRLQLELGPNWYAKFSAALAQYQEELIGRHMDADDVAIMARQLFASMTRREFEDAINHLVIGYWAELVEEERDESLLSPAMRVIRGGLEDGAA